LFQAKTEERIMRKFWVIVLLALGLMVVLAACGGGDAAPAETAATGPVGNAARGQRLYEQTVIGQASAPGCITCHSMEPGVVLVGPSHAGLAARAGDYVAELSAEEYLRQSIIEPDAHIVEGFTPGVMYQNYGTELNEQEIADLVAYMLTLQ
jgi:cytochrome c2